MKKIYSFALMVVFISGFIACNIASANNVGNVNIHLKSNPEQFSYHFKADLEINYKSRDLYNDKVLLSYHVYDINNKELLWEGKRIPISIDSHGNGKISLDVDLKAELPTIDAKYARVKFDLVDEKNVFWYSTNPDIKFSADQITINKNFAKKFIGTLLSAIKNSPIVFGLNILCLIGFIFIFIKFRRELS